MEFFELSLSLSLKQAFRSATLVKPRGRNSLNPLFGIHTLTNTQTHKHTHTHTPSDTLRRIIPWKFAEILCPLHLRERNSFQGITREICDISPPNDINICLFVIAKAVFPTQSLHKDDETDGNKNATIVCALGCERFFTFRQPLCVNVT